MKRLELNSSSEIRKVAQALSGEIRLRMLDLLKGQELSLNEIASALMIPLSTATVNIQKLDEAGLINIDFQPGIRGTRKLCSLAYDTINLSLNDPHNGQEEISMPIGHFVNAEINPPCGICTSKEQLGRKDDPTAFFYPEKSEAQLIWFSTGWLEYRFPNILKEGDEAESLEFQMELCSEVPGFDKNASSDITLWVNEKEAATWRSPGDFGGKRGRLTPRWWPSRNTQYGLPVQWKITKNGTFCNNEKGGDLKPEDLDLSSQPYILIRLGVKKEAEFPGGMNLFGSRFGNHPIDIQLKINRSN
jgi:predicted transcriptional regulator